MSEVIQRRPGRPRKHETKLVPITGYVLPEEKAAVEAALKEGQSIGDWVHEAVKAKLATA